MNPSAHISPLTSHHSSYCLIWFTGSCSRMLDRMQPPMPGVNHFNCSPLCFSHCYTRPEAWAPSLSAPSAFLLKKYKKHEKVVPKRVTCQRRAAKAVQCLPSTENHSLSSSDGKPYCSVGHLKMGSTTLTSPATPHLQFYMPRSQTHSMLPNTQYTEQ